MASSSLPNPVRYVCENVMPVQEGRNEPEVRNVKETLEPVSIMDGTMQRTVVGSSPFPATNDGQLDASLAPGAGIVKPNNTHVYYLDLAPGASSPIHRTVSTDFLIVMKGHPSIISPKGPYSIVDGKADFKETEEIVLNEGDNVVQRGHMHALANNTTEWVRFLGVVVDATPMKIEVPGQEEVKTLQELWL